MDSPLTDAATVRSMLGGVTLLDVRWLLGRSDGHEQYLAGHLPGAVFVDLEHDLADPPGDPVDARGRHPLPSPERFTAAMRRCGVRTDLPVVVYDDNAGAAAARAWWLLDDAGHPDVRLLDGGLAAWRALGEEAETGEVVPEPGDFTAQPGRRPVVDADGAAALTVDGVLVDARAGERYRAETEPVDPVAGHVPGAVNVPLTDNTVAGPDGVRRFRPAADLAALYHDATDGRAVGVYCGSGVTAAHDVLALQVLGVRAALYPGSWSGWVSAGDRPVATGPRP